jgi:hypothetical protein
MKNRKIEILFGIILLIVTIYIAGFSSHSVKEYYSKQHKGEPTIIDTPFGKATPAMNLNGLWELITPLIIVGFCMGMPIFWAFTGKGDLGSGESTTFKKIRDFSIFYGIAVLAYYIFVT